MSEDKMNWDLTSYFPEFNGKEMKEFKESLVSDLNSTLELARSLENISDDTWPEWEKVFIAGEELSRKFLGFHNKIIYTSALCAVVL